MSRQRECDYLNICRQTWQNSIIKKTRTKYKTQNKLEIERNFANQKNKL